MTLYWCGHNFSVFTNIIFGVTSHQWLPENHYFHSTLVDFEAPCTSDARDVLVYGAHGPCNCNPKTFLGKILSVNGEDHQPTKYTSRTFQIGAGGFSFPYGAVEWLNQNMTQYTGPVKYHAVAYANSNCVREREEMVKALSKIVPVHAFGKCTGKGSAIGIKKTAHWISNKKIFEGYAFVFAAEHGVTDGYVTEKPFVAAASGAVPVYWGDDALLKNFMNPHRVMVWNNSTPYLVKKNMNSNLRQLPAVNKNNLIKKARKLILNFFKL